MRLRDSSCSLQTQRLPCSQEVPSVFLLSHTDTCCELTKGSWLTFSIASKGGMALNSSVTLLLASSRSHLRTGGVPVMEEVILQLAA